MGNLRQKYTDEEWDELARNPERGIKITNNKSELIKAYEKLVFGEGTNIGLLQCLDPYYIGAFDEDIANIEKLKDD